MAGHAHYTVVVDACVFYSGLKTDALMSLCSRGLFAAKWSRRIEDEWIRALKVNRPELHEKVDSRQAAMRSAVLDWEVPEEAICALEPGLQLPDPDDRHVLAAAIAGHADCIVTDNLKDFPIEIVELYGIEIVDPDRFIINQLDLDEYIALAALKAMRKRWRKPEASAEDFATAFERFDMPLTAQRLRERLELI